jgi:hypothetical protein
MNCRWTDRSPDAVFLCDESRSQAFCKLSSTAGRKSKNNNNNNNNTKQQQQQQQH